MKTEIKNGKKKKTIESEFPKRAVVAILDTRLEDFNKLTVNGLAEQLNVPVPSLSRAFKRDFNMNLITFLVMTKLLCGVYFLETFPELGLEKIAAYLDYETPWYFEEIYVKYFGITPEEYRLVYTSVLKPGIDSIKDKPTVAGRDAAVDTVMTAADMMKGRFTIMDDYFEFMLDLTSPGKIYSLPEEVTPKPKTVTPKPETVTTKPETVATKPKTVTTKPETVATKPKTVATKPKTVATKPKTVTPKPETVATKPETVAPKPKTVATKPKTVAPKPKTVTTKPETVATGPARAAPGPGG